MEYICGLVISALLIAIARWVATPTSYGTEHWDDDQPEWDGYESWADRERHDSVEPEWEGDDDDY